MEAVKEVTGTIREVKILVLGTEDQGGLLRRVEGISKSVHDLNNRMTVVTLEIEELKTHIRDRRKN